MLITDLLADLDVGTVVGADGERPVECELHVAGARSFGARRGDLLGEVGPGHHLLRHRHGIVRQENDFETATGAGVVVDGACDIMDEMDDRLGGRIGRGRLTSEHHGTRHPVGGRICDDRLPTTDHVHDVQQLALIFVYPLDLHVEQARRIDLDAGAALDVGREPYLVGLLHAVERVAEACIVDVSPQLCEPVEVGPPALPQRTIEQSGEAAVRLRKPAPRRHAVGDIGEPVRP